MKSLTLGNAAIILIVFLVTQLTQPALAVFYQPGDWVDYNNFRYVTSIAYNNSVVYYGTTGGVTRYDTDADSWMDPLTIADGLPSNYVRALAYDPDYDALWMVTDFGTGNYNMTFESWTTDDNFPDSLVVNDWQPSAFPSLFMPINFDYADGYVLDPDLQRYAVTVGYKDEFSDLMYVGTWGLGTATIDTRHLDYTAYNFGPYDQSISRVIRIGNVLWMGTNLNSSESGITRYDLNLQEWDYYETELIPGLANTEVTSGSDSKDYTWLGTTDGLLKIESDQNVRTYNSPILLPSAYILSLAEYGGYLYVGTDNGLQVLPSKGEITDSLYKSPLPEDLLLRGQQVNDLHVFGKALYIATDYGVYSYNSGEHQFRNLDTPTADLSSGATSISSDSLNLYFATRLGVVVVNTVTESSYVAAESRLAGDWLISQVYGDKNFIWAATDFGLWKYRKVDQSTYLYTTADGLPVNEVNSLVRDGDYFWMGTSKGLVRFLWNAPGRGD